MLPAAQVVLTLIVLFLVVFLLGFIADPIINIYSDPWSYVMPWAAPDYDDYYDDGEVVTWYEHFAKGIASVGVLGFLKVLLANPLSYFRIGGGGGRGRNTGRDRYEQISWLVLLIGIGTFLVVCDQPNQFAFVGRLTQSRQYIKGCELGVAAR